ncbi:hypothetical protein PFISCL1PPCAC_21682, partial [Pristionchus fissidentatus]
LDSTERSSDLQPETPIGYMDTIQRSSVEDRQLMQQIEPVQPTDLSAFYEDRTTAQPVEQIQSVDLSDIYDEKPQQPVTRKASIVPDRPSADRSSMLVEEEQSHEEMPDFAQISVVERSKPEEEEAIIDSVSPSDDVTVKSAELVGAPRTAEYDARPVDHHVVEHDYAVVEIPDADQFVLVTPEVEKPTHSSEFVIDSSYAQPSHETIDRPVQPSAPRFSDQDYEIIERNEIATVPLSEKEEKKYDDVVKSAVHCEDDKPLPATPEPEYEIVREEHLPTVPAHGEKRDTDVERFQIVGADLSPERVQPVITDELEDRYRSTGADLPPKTVTKPSGMALSSFSETIERTTKTRKTPKEENERPITDLTTDYEKRTPKDLVYPERPIPEPSTSEQYRSQVVSDIHPSDWLEREAVTESPKRPLSHLTSTTITERTERYTRKSPTPDRSPRPETYVDYELQRDVTELSPERLLDRFQPVREIERIDREIVELSPERLADRHAERHTSPPLGWTVSISARHPPPRTPSPVEVISPRRHVSPEYRRFEESSTYSPRTAPSSSLWHDDDSRLSRRETADRSARLGVQSDPRRRQLSPHSWTTIRESTEISYVRRTHHTSSTTRRSPPDSARYQTWNTATTTTRAPATTRGDFYSLSPTREFSAVLPRHPIQPDRYRGQSEDTRRDTRRRAPHPTVSSGAPCDRPANCGIRRGGPSWTSMGIHHPVYPPREGLYMERRESAMNGHGIDRPTNGIERPTNGHANGHRGSLSARAAPTVTYTSQSATSPRGANPPSYYTYMEQRVFRVPRPEYRASPVDARRRRMEEQGAFEPVREISASDRTETLTRYPYSPEYISPTRRAESGVFTLRTPPPPIQHVRGYVERDDRGVEYLVHRPSNLNELPPMSDRIQTLPDIEDGAQLCRTSTVPPYDESEARARRRTIRRQRQRMRNYCNML